jgi:hypothetical protein
VYQDVDDLLEVGKALNPNIKTFDAACFDGHYVTGVHAQLSCQAQTFTDLQPALPPPPPCPCILSDAGAVQLCCIKPHHHASQVLRMCACGVQVGTSN